MRWNLRRFWFEFDTDSPVIRACGVTAIDRDDALLILERQVFKGPVPPIRSERSDVDVSTLDAGHVLMNMGDPTLRGVWFPLGFHSSFS